MDAVTLGVKCWEDGGFVDDAASRYSEAEVRTMRATLLGNGHRYLSKEVAGLERLIEKLAHNPTFYKTSY